MKLDLYVPTRIRFGPGRVAEVGAVAREYGEHALLVTGQTSMRRHGILERVTRTLQDAGLAATVFDRVSPNPSVAEVDAAVAEARRNACDVVVAVGGGSALDAGKAVAVGMETDSVAPLLGTTIPTTGAALPVVAVPTTAGSGSEVTKGAIVTDTGRRFRSGIRGEDLFPRAAVVDPELVATAPPGLAAETGFDALAHAIEGSVSRAATPLSRGLAAQAITLLARHLPVAVRGEGSPADHEALCLAALLGGINVASVSTCLPHRLQQAMGAVDQQISHGRGLAAVYPAWLRHAESFASAPLSEIAALLGHDDVHHAVAALRRDLALTGGLREHGIDDDDVDEMVAAVSGNLDNDPIEQVGPELMAAVYRESL